LGLFWPIFDLNFGINIATPNTTMIAQLCNLLCNIVQPNLAKDS